MARTSASLSDGAPVTPFAAAFGPAVVCAAALAVPLVYLPNLNSVFAEPKMALLYLAGALGLASRMLARAFSPSSSSSPRLSRSLQLAVAALLATTLLAAAVAAARGAPGAPYAGAEIARLLAVVGVAFAAAQATADPRWLRRLLTSIHISAGLVSLIGLLQHLQLLPLAIPTISVPGSTFGNRNIAAEAVAMSIPFGLGWLALALARRGGAGAKEVTPAAPASRAARDTRTFGASDDNVRRDPVGAILFLLALELAYLGATRTRGAWLGAASGVAVFFGLRWLAGRRGGADPRAGVMVALVLGAAALAAAVIPGRVIPRDVADAKRFEPGPHVVREVVDPTSPVVRTRLGLWRRTLAMYRAHPVLGAGPGNFTVFFPLYAEPGARADGVLTPTVVPRRAHQDLLERLAETGIVGLAALLAVYAVAAGIAVRRARRAAEETGRSGGDGSAAAAAASAALNLAPPDDRAALAASAAAALAVLFTCGLTGFPLAMPGTALLFGVALGVLAAKRATAPTEPPRGGATIAPAGSRVAARSVVVLMAALLVAGTAVGAARSVRRSYWLARARAALRSPDHPGLGPPAALEALRRAERAEPGQFEVALETGFVLLRLARAADARRAVDRALAIEPHCANAWALRAEADLGAGDAPLAAADADRATAILNDYPDAIAARGRAGQWLGDQRALQAARDHLSALAAAGDERAARLLGSMPPGAGH